MDKHEYILDGLTTYVENQHSRTPPNMFTCRKNGELEKFFAYSYDDFAAKEILRQLKEDPLPFGGPICALNLLVGDLNDKCCECKTEESKNVFISFYEVAMELLDIAYILEEDYKEKEGGK